LSGEWRRTKSREASQKQIDHQNSKIQSCRRESLGIINRRGPELLRRGSWHIREEALRHFKQLRKADGRLTKDALENIQSCRRESLGRLNRDGPVLLKRGSWQIKVGALRQIKQLERS